MRLNNIARPELYVIGACVAVAGGIYFFQTVWHSGGSAGTPASTAIVVLTDKGFEPNEVTVKVGGTVTFSTSRDKPFWPASDPHPSHGIYPQFDSRKSLSKDEEWTFQFDRVGEWGYHDHLRSYFTGKIYVVP